MFKPVAILAVFLGAHLYTRPACRRFQRRAALVIGLFLLSPVAAGWLLSLLATSGIGPFGSDGRQLLSMARELFPLAQLWSTTGRRSRSG